MAINPYPMGEKTSTELSKRMLAQFGCVSFVLPSKERESAFDALVLDECIDKLHLKICGTDYDYVNQVYNAAHGYVLGSGLDLVRALEIVSMERRLNKGEYRLSFMSESSLSDAISEQRRPGWWPLYDNKSFMLFSADHEYDGSGELLIRYNFQNPFV